MISVAIGKPDRAIRLLGVGLSLLALAALLAGCGGRGDTGISNIKIASAKLGTVESTNTVALAPEEVHAVQRCLGLARQPYKKGRHGFTFFKYVLELEGVPEPSDMAQKHLYGALFFQEDFSLLGTDMPETDRVQLQKLVRSVARRLSPAESHPVPK